MKRILLFLSILLSPVFISGQGNVHFYQQFSTAFQSGNASSLSRMLDDEVDYQYQGTEGRFSRVEAENSLRFFFSKSKPAQFEFKHQGSSADGQLYGIGQLKTEEGKQYRVTCRARAVGPSYRIIRLDIEG